MATSLLEQNQQHLAAIIDQPSQRQVKHPPQQRQAAKGEPRPGAGDELDSSDDSDQFPPSQVFMGDKQQTNGGADATKQSNASKFDKLLKVSVL